MGTRYFKEYYQVLSGLMFCQLDKPVCGSVAGYCLDVTGVDGRTMGLYTQSLEVSEKVFLQNFLAALGWRLTVTNLEASVIFARWETLLIFGPSPADNPVIEEACEVKNSVPIHCIRNQEKNFVFLPALADMMQDGALKKRVWETVK